MVQEKACRKCKIIVTGKECPVCKGQDLTPHWKGMAVIINPQKSQIAQKIGAELPGEYALKVR